QMTPGREQPHVSPLAQAGAYLRARLEDERCLTPGKEMRGGCESHGPRTQYRYRQGTGDLGPARVCWHTIPRRSSIGWYVLTISHTSTAVNVSRGALPLHGMAGGRSPAARPLAVSAT